MSRWVSVCCFGFVHLLVFCVWILSLVRVCIRCLLVALGVSLSKQFDCFVVSVCKFVCTIGDEILCSCLLCCVNKCARACCFSSSVGMVEARLFDFASQQFRPNCLSVQHSCAACSPVYFC